MLSQNSIVNFILINSYLMFLSTLQHFLFQYANVEMSNEFYIFGIIYLFLMMKNILMERQLNYALSEKKYIDEDVHLRNNKIDYVKLSWLFVELIFIETFFYIFAMKNYDFKQTNYFNDIIYFVPISFIYEIVFDFFHYFTHRIEHSNKYLYQNIHKTHHTFSHPTTVITYYHHPIDIIFTNVIPQILTLCIIPKISIFTFNIILTYKTFIELSGHSGKLINSTSFVQFVWLPKLFGIELHTEDHDAHHKFNNCNYSKRFKLWDLIFHTYKSNNTKLMQN